MKVISLDTNYRSHQSILDASFAMIENNYEGDEHKDLRIELKSGAVIPASPAKRKRSRAQAGIQDHNTSNGGETLDSRFRGNDTKKITYPNRPVM